MADEAVLLVFYDFMIPRIRSRVEMKYPLKKQWVLGYNDKRIILLWRNAQACKEA